MTVCFTRYSMMTSSTVRNSSTLVALTLKAKSPIESPSKLNDHCSDSEKVLFKNKVDKLMVKK